MMQALRLKPFKGIKEYEPKFKEVVLRGLPPFNGKESAYYNLITYFGGKYKMLKYILPLVEQLAIANQAHTFIECFGGGGKCILNLDKLTYKFNHAIYNEWDRNLCSLFKVASEPDTAEELACIMANLDCNKELFEQYKIKIKENSDSLTDIERASMMMYVCLLSYNSNQRGYKPESIEVRKQYYKSAQSISKAPQHLQGVGIVNDDYINIMKLYGSDPKVIKYIDPPYHPACRNQGALKVYPNELTIEQHKELVQILCSSHGWLLSGYDPAQWGCDDYAPLEAAGATKVSLGHFIVSIKHKSYKEEYIWYKN